VLSLPATFWEWAVFVGAIAVAALFVTEIRRWLGRWVVVTRKQKTIRISLLVLIETLLVMVYVGIKRDGFGDPIRELIYWSICVTIGLVILLLAMFDLLATSHGYSTLHRRVMREVLHDERGDK
jgi:hypothetical protein